MSSVRRSLDFQAACVRHVLGTKPDLQPDVLEGAEQALRTLEWMAKGDDVLRAFVAMRREAPESFVAFCEILAAFPGAKMRIVATGDADVREMAE